MALCFSNISKQTIKIFFRSINTNFKDHLCDFQNNLAMPL